MENVGNVFIKRLQTFFSSFFNDFNVFLNFYLNVYYMWLNGLVVSALGIRTRGSRFDSRVAPLFHWVATLDSFSAKKNCGIKREFSAPKWLW